MQNSNSHNPFAGHAVQDRYSQRSATYLSKVSGWMFAGLGITALVALLFDKLVGFQDFFAGNAITLFVIFGIELLLVFFLSWKYESMSGPTAGMFFFIYAALNGITLSGLLEIYTGASLISTFFVASAMFGALGAFGFLTKKDLSAWGSALFVALIGLIIASLVGFFLHSDTLQLLISFAGVLIFAGFTAYDFNIIKQKGSYEQGESTAVVDALSLYLDFINLFIYLLRIIGSSNN